MKDVCSKCKVREIPPTRSVCEVCCPLEPDEELNRRLKIVRIDRELFASLFKTGASDRYVRCTDGLPKDAEFVGISEQLFFTSNEIAVKFRSKEFPVVEPGHAIPLANPLFGALHVTAADLKFLADNPEYKRTAEYRSDSFVGTSPVASAARHVDAADLVDELRRKEFEAAGERMAAQRRSVGMDEPAPHVVWGT